MASNTFEIKLPQFEGPFDLLLFFIERDELDVYDIPISTITQDFLQYIHQLQTLNIDVASEFILVAATLMKIKSRMLIPRKELDEKGNEIDPRKELVDRLLEYKKYKAVAEQLSKLEEDRLQMIKRGNTTEELAHIAQMYTTESEMETVTVVKLLQAFKAILKRKEAQNNKVQHTVTPYPYEISTEKETIYGRVKQKGKLAFEEAFDSCENRVHAIYKFLAVLECIQERVLEIQIGEGINTFWLTIATPDAA